MEVYEIAGYQTGVSRGGVNYLQPADSFQNIVNGFIYRQVLQSRKGFSVFGTRLANGFRVMGIFEYNLPNGSKELLVFDTNNMYRYNIATGNFDIISFGGTMSGYAGFNITSKDAYISGISYPTASNTGRFVFTGIEIQVNGNNSAVFFYDGINIKDYTNTTDNPNYQAPAISASLTKLVRSKYILFYKQRINFISPEITGASTTTYTNGFLYSAPFSASGTGDKFNSPGAGLKVLSTSESINGALVRGEIIVLRCNRSDWSVESTTDVFNPYFDRKIPSVIGTNADFSSVQWGDIVRSLGKTGAVSTDGRQSLRFDNKIPYFTADEISQSEFNLTYGGFDRDNSQFIWSYKSNGSSGDTQDSVLVYNYEEETWSIYDQRFSVFGQSDLGQTFTWDEIYELNDPSWKQWNTTEQLWDKIGIGDTVQKTLAGDDLGFIYELNQDYDDYYTDITGLAVGGTTILTVNATGILAGDLVTVSGVEGMTSINNFDPQTNTQTGTPYTVISATPTLIEINFVSTGQPAYTPNTGSISKVISFSAETIPFNPYRSIGRRCYVSHVEILIENNGGRLLLDVYGSSKASYVKQNILCQPDINSTIGNQYITVTVDNEDNFHTFVFRQQSPAVQLRLTSMRIHAKPGGMTSG